MITLTIFMFMNLMLIRLHLLERRLRDNLELIQNKKESIDIIDLKTHACELSKFNLIVLIFDITRWKNNSWFPSLAKYREEE